MRTHVPAVTPNQDWLESSSCYFRIKTYFRLSAADDVQDDTSLCRYAEAFKLHFYSYQMPIILDARLHLNGNQIFVDRRELVIFGECVIPS